MFQLIIFTTPSLVFASLIHDSGITIVGVSVIHPSGRPGIGFNIPLGTPNGNGARLVISSPGKVTIEQRGILWLRYPEMEGNFPWTPGQNAAFNTDDFYLQDSVPPVPVPVPPSNETPKEIIDRIYNTGNYNLATKDGCGQFTEACCTELHNKHSAEWGHLRKSGAQNQYNGHAVDAIMLLVQVGETEAGVYDIVISSESPGAKPAFNRVGPPNNLLWYYPA